MTYRDSHGTPRKIGKKLGEGGEGAVFVTDDSNLVAKIYSRPLNNLQVAKLQTMVDACDDTLRSVAAWPVGVLYEGARPIGFTMPRLLAQAPLHELLGPKRRQMLFPDANWKFLIHTAENVSRAFEVLHGRGIIVGDVNSSNVVVYRDSKAHFIDCDSFQVAANGTVFRCCVGVAEYQPPELHGKDLARVDRMPQHDLFGLAVMVFQLLFVGKHPFAGVLPTHIRNTGAIGDNVAAQRYFYGPNARRMGLKPPPGALSLTAITPEVSTLFAQAFLGEPRSRPSAGTWRAALQDLQQKTIVCKKTHQHRHLEGKRCPWCALERRGLYYFGGTMAAGSPGGAADESSWPRFTDGDIERAWAEVAAVQPPPPVNSNLSRARVYVPAPLGLWTNARKAGYVAGGVAGLAGIVALGALHQPWFALALGVLLLALAVLCRPNARAVIAARRRRRSQTYRDYVGAANEWTRAAKNLHFNEARDRLALVYKQLCDQRKRYGAELATLERNRSMREKQAYLQGHQIATQRVLGIDQRTLALLRSFGVETAADCTEQGLKAVRGLSRPKKNQLTSWRQNLENRFRYDPRKGLDPKVVREVKGRFVRERVTHQAELCGGALLLRQIAADIDRQRPSLQRLARQRAEAMWQAEADTHISPVWYLL
jgi:DNA-binding helix-hairpin-helix protein with protein kinase domain